MAWVNTTEHSGYSNIVQDDGPSGALYIRYNPDGSFKYVFKWRLLQEKKLRVMSKGKKTMTDQQIRNFIMYYERLTKHMLKIFPKG